MAGLPGGGPNTRILETESRGHEGTAGVVVFDARLSSRKDDKRVT